MPALDGTSIVAIGSFAVLVLAWLVAPSGAEIAADAELQPVAA